jgi:hypothetical protein
MQVNEKTFRALVDAGAVRRVRIIADGARFHVEADTQNGTLIASTGRGAPAPSGRSTPPRDGFTASASATPTWMSAAGDRASAASRSKRT